MQQVEVFKIDERDAGSVRPSAEGTGNSASRVLQDYAGEHVRLGTWIAEPGTYSSGGVPVGECFVVLSGTGELSLEGYEKISLSAGTVVKMAANCPSQIHVTETLAKVSLTGL